jgi:hypothetical protein
VSVNETSVDSTIFDLSTVHHASDFYSRDPMEREAKPFKVIRATLCPVKEFNQKEIAY